MITNTKLKDISIRMKSCEKAVFCLVCTHRNVHQQFQVRGVRIQNFITKAKVRLANETTRKKNRNERCQLTVRFALPPPDELRCAE